MNAATASAYIGQFFSGAVEPSTPHLVLILAAVGGGLAVGIGIIWEACRSGHLWTWPTAFVFIGVVVEAAATVILFEFDEGISRKQQSLISAQNEKIIAVGKALLHRHLVNLNSDFIQDEVNNKFSELLRWRMYSGPEPTQTNRSVYIQVVPDLEAQNLARELSAIFRIAGWLPPQYVQPNETHIDPGVIQEGVVVIALPSLPLSDSNGAFNTDMISQAELISATLSKAGLTDWSGAPIRRHIRIEDTGVPGTPRYPQFDQAPKSGIFIEVGANPVTGVLSKILSAKAAPP